MELAVKLVNIIIKNKYLLWMKHCAKTLSKMPQIHSKTRKNVLAAGGYAPDPVGELII